VLNIQQLKAKHDGYLIFQVITDIENWMGTAEFLYLDMVCMGSPAIIIISKKSKQTSAGNFN